MFRIAVCDDELIFAEKIAGACKSILEKHFGEEKFFSVDLFTNGVDLISEHGKDVRYDIIFLDILMDQIDGITVASVIRSKDKNVPIVFLTSSDEYALKGYEVQAYRYLIKSISEFNGWSQLEMVIDQILAERKKKEKRLLLKEGGGFKSIAFEDILYLEIYGRKTKIHTKRENLICNEKMSEIAEQLDDEIFIKCHQSYIINLKYAYEIRKYHFILANKATIPISRVYWEDVKAAFLYNVSNG